jgi:hypothetical protein
MHRPLFLIVLIAASLAAAEPKIVEKPEAHKTLVNPECSHCRDEAKRRLRELRADDRVLSWTRGYSDGGAIPIRFFLRTYRVISDSYGTFVYDPEAGFARAFAPSYQFTFHGWRNGVMVMKHADGTVFSCLSGVGVEGPRKGKRLQPIPSLVSNWGFWLDRYPGAVAFRMYDKYKPVAPLVKEEADSVRSRIKPDPRLKPSEMVLGVWAGETARAYPFSLLTKSGLVKDRIGRTSVVVLYDPISQTASAYRPVASQPRKFKGPTPDKKTGESKLDPGTPLPAGSRELPPRTVTLAISGLKAPARFRDKETNSYWDITGRCVSGKMKGWTLEWVDSVQVKWFAWSAEYPKTEIYRPPPP